MQRYRSGHNGADSKSVLRATARGFESHPLRQKSLETKRFQGIFCVMKGKCPQNTLKCCLETCAKKFVVPQWCPAPKNDPRDAMWV